MTSRCDITRVFWDPDTVCKGESVSVCVIRAVTTSLSLSSCAGEASKCLQCAARKCVTGREGVAVECGVLLSVVCSCVCEVSSAVLDA
jgi:hypothetical protein